MRIRTLLLVSMIVLIGAFAVINWPLFMVPATLNLLVTTVEAPLGLVLLAILVVVVLVFSTYMALWQGSYLLESRRHSQEMKEQRLLADQAEASRVAELRSLLMAETSRLNERLAQVQQALQSDIRDNGNSIAAHIAEFDDRLSRNAAPRLSPA